MNSKIIDGFDIPIGLFMFKRADTTVRIIKRIASIKPKKLYLIADAGRTEEEQKMAEVCRVAVLEAIDWPCEVIKYFADENRGVYANIGLGAKWVFEREKEAIFIEDDNETIMRKFKRAVTDSLNQIKYDEENQPGVSNLLTIISACEKRY